MLASLNTQVTQRQISFLNAHWRCQVGLNNVSTNRVSEELIKWLRVLLFQTPKGPILCWQRNDKALCLQALFHYGTVPAYLNILYNMLITAFGIIRKKGLFVAKMHMYFYKHFSICAFRKQRSTFLQKWHIYSSYRSVCALAKLIRLAVEVWNHRK